MQIAVDDCYPPGGLIADWMEFCEPFEFPKSYALMSLLAVASCAIEGRVLVNPGTQPSPFTNLYVVLYGPSGSRKGAAMEYARELLARALPDSPILPSSGTMQGLIDELAEKTQALNRAPGMIYSEEFSDFIGGADYLERNSMILTQLYDCRGEWTERTRQHKKITVSNPYVVILGASNPDWFENVNPRLLTGGFLRRLLLVVEYGPRQESHAPLANTVLFNAMVDRLRDRFSPLAYGGALMRMTPDAHAADRYWYQTVVRGLRGKARSEREAHFVNTIQEHAIKLAAIIELIERPLGVRPEWLSKEAIVCGQRLVLRLLPRIFQAYQSLAGTPLARRRAAIMRIARAFGGEIARATLTRAVVADLGVEHKEVEKALAGLMADGLLLVGERGGVVLAPEEAKWQAD